MEMVSAMLVEEPLCEAKATKEEKEPRLLTDHLMEVAQDYQTLLGRDPQNAEALLGMGLVALASGQTAAAVQMSRAGVQAAPQMIPAWVTLGQALAADQQFEEAEAAYMQAIRMDGMDPLARMGLGELRLTEGKAEQAAAEFGLVLRKNPAQAAAHLGLGNALAFLGKNEEALAAYEQALTLKPRLPEGEFAAGFVLGRMGRNHEAMLRYRRVLFAQPEHAAAWLNLGCLLREQNQDVFAEAALKRALELRPDLLKGWIHLGLLERDRNRPEEAEKYLRKAIELQPDQVETLVAWCQFRLAENDRAGAWAWLRWALWRNPQHEEALNMQGILLHNEGLYEEAIAIFLRAEALGHKPASANRGNTLLDLGRVEEALEAQALAARLDPENPGALYNLALTRLRMGQWEQGWRDYEMRWNFRGVHLKPRHFDEPRWKGECLKGQRVLLHAEQGLGDTIQFCRYAELVVERGGRPLLVVQKPVAELLRSLRIVREGLAEVSVLGEPMAPFDLECPLLSLPAVFGTTVDSVPWPGAYLGAEEAAIAVKRALFADDGRQTRVGLAWAGNPRYKADSRRSMHLCTLLPLLRTPGFRWFALQKGEAAAQLAELPEEVRVEDGSSQEKDLSEAAALIATLDCVVTTDTCIAHLAGAMNKPVWMLLPWQSDWRWMQERATTPWYPSVCLVRQKQKGDWAGVLEQVIAEIEDYRRTV
ncbi:tetratricopeptide repeat protein [Telmatobacter bradus]|uniref:tetratricopeptide repeat protein n=1 Tax=Telmatobacter bradus TaxID=474953 RepID=UPI003B42C3DC